MCDTVASLDALQDPMIQVNTSLSQNSRLSSQLLAGPQRGVDRACRDRHHRVGQVPRNAHVWFAPASLEAAMSANCLIA